MRPGNVLCANLYHAATFARAIVRELRFFAPISAIKSLTVPKRWSLLAFLFVYLALVRYCAYAYYGDPTSAFFDPTRGYQRSYSLERQKEVDAFVSNTSISFAADKRKREPRMCIGIATVRREEEQYVETTVGSLLEGLTDKERAEIYLAILIAHTDPNDHPGYSEDWIHLANKVYLYDVSQARKDELKTWEKERNFVKKGVFDYTYTLRKCLSTGAQWITMIEDDTLAVKGWYPRTIEALERADDQHRATKERSDWLYLRLFFTEEFLGWNVEDWPYNLLACIGISGAVTISLLLLRQLPCVKGISNSIIVGQALFITPALMILYFLAGRLSMQPLHPGVYEMPKFGCCAQGFVFSHEMASKVIDRLEHVNEGFVDEILEAWANERSLVRWVVIPSLLQHVGGHSSKGDDFDGQAKYDRSVAEKIWNFGFEKYNVETVGYS